MSGTMVHDTRPSLRRRGGSAKRCFRIFLAHFSMAFALLVWAGGPVWGQGNQCVDCHEAERLPIFLGHSFDEWRVSAHGRVGVTCEKCHGGDPTVALAGKAHAGVLVTADPQSRVHVTHVAETCGECHQAELAAYSGTVHAKQVREKKVGATCLTCHGSMATSLPSPSELRARCAVCHEKPVEAQAALALLASSKLQLHRVRRALRAAEARGGDWYAGALQRFHEMERAYADISLRWHTFRTDETLHHSRDLLHLAKLLGEEIELRTKEP